MGRAIGPWLVAGGVILLAVGLMAWSGWLSWFGQLPGDIRIEGRHTRVYIPITSMILVSVFLNLLLYLLLFLTRR
jgi:uncharacterized protein HemY